MTEAAERGTTTITDRAVRKIAQRAAGEVLPPSLAGAARGSARVRGRRAGVTLRVALPYPTPLSETARQVREHVADRTRELTGLDVPPPRLTVSRLATSAPAPAPAPPPGAVRPGPRYWWSARRVPTAVLLLVGTAVAATVTADVLRVRVLHHHPAAWRLRAVDWLSGHGPGDPAVTAGSLVAVALGVWLLVLALTPGRRRQLALGTAASGVRGAVDRKAVAALVQDAVDEVNGLTGVRVRVGRRRVLVRARLAFGERGDALRHAVAAAEGAVERCRLRRPPRCRVVVVPDPTWRPPLSPTESGTKAFVPGPATSGLPAGTATSGLPAGTAGGPESGPATGDPTPAPATSGPESGGSATSGPESASATSGPESASATGGPPSRSAAGEQEGATA
ncbi:DUF6286 domain-containing protein [Streptomyces sp. NPDC002185]|uniref:DUF6286 domain-containing protein n=1 Tax=Streptomyces sp. NPDC002185 TaxID=3364636 RepID=UPI00369EFD8F